MTSRELYAKNEELKPEPLPQGNLLFIFAVNCSSLWRSKTLF